MNFLVASSSISIIQTFDYIVQRLIIATAMIYYKISIKSLLPSLNHRHLSSRYVIKNIGNAQAC